MLLIVLTRRTSRCQSVVTQRATKIVNFSVWLIQPYDKIMTNDSLILRFTLGLPYKIEPLFIFIKFAFSLGNKYLTLAISDDVNLDLDHFNSLDGLSFYYKRPLEISHDYLDIEIR